MRTRSIFALTAALAITTTITLAGCGNTEQSPQADTSSAPVDVVWEPVSTEPDDDTGADLTTEAKQDQPATDITQPGPNGSITVTIPDGWECRTCDVGDSELIDGGYGIHLYPAGNTPIWSFIVFGEGHDGIVANTVLVSDWWDLEAPTGEDSVTYGEQAWQILETLQYDPDDRTDDQSQPL